MADPASTETVPTAPKKTVKKKKSEVNPVSKPADSGFGSTENVHSALDAAGGSNRRSSSTKESSNDATQQSTNNAAPGDGNGEASSSSRRGSQQQPPPGTPGAAGRTASLADPSSPATIAEEGVETSFNSDLANSENEKIAPSNEDERRKSSGGAGGGVKGSSSTSLPTSSDDLPMNVDPNADKISREELINYRIACDSLIKDLQDRLSHEEDAAASLQSNKKKLEGDVSNLKKEIENLELALQKVSLVLSRHNSLRLTFE